MMIMLGFFQAIEGLVALFDDGFYLVRPRWAHGNVDHNAWAGTTDRRWSGVGDVDTTRAHLRRVMPVRCRGPTVGRSAVAPCQ
jgi:hypothetical protein